MGQHSGTRRKHYSLGWIFGVHVAAGLLLIAMGLHYWGAAEIRAEAGEVILLTGVGGAILAMATKLFAWLGLSYRDDVADGNNGAALVALCGAVVAAAIIYAGGSVGEGPSYADNVFSAGLGAAGWFLLWLVLEIGGGVSRSITEDRDLGSGIRLWGFLVAIALVLGRAVAGDWVSVADTVHDFLRDGWPALVICLGALVSERFARPSRRRPFPAWQGFGLIPALLYLGLTVAWLSYLGRWEGMPR
jgi:hypothetical protein